MGRELTGRQRVALVAIARSIRDRGYAPTQRELVRLIGFRSCRWGNQLVGALVARGYLERDPRKSRAVRLTEAGWLAVADQVATFRFVPARKCPRCLATHFREACPFCFCSPAVVSSGHAGGPG